MQFRNNPQGRIARMEFLADIRRNQKCICPVCNQWMELDNCTFVNDKFEEGTKPEVRHKQCPETNYLQR